MNKLRKASTLIIISAIEANITRKYDYKVTLLKRSAKMRAWPGSYVFPGGRIDATDESTNWLSVLLSTQQLKAIQSDTKHVNNIFKAFMNNNSIGNRLNARNTSSNNSIINKLPAELSFRLCAIRETFEEIGVLLAHEKKSETNSNYFQESSLLTACYERNLKDWQMRVKHKPDEFINLFRELNLIPDLSGLHEWSNWITPLNEKTRFDTIFFTCFLPKLPDAMLYNLDYDEIEKLEEFTPEEVLDKFETNDIKLIPPQTYEFKRLLKFKEFAKLSEYSRHRQKYGLIQWLPKFNREFNFGVLPGDYMYDLVNELDERSLDELLILSNALKRDNSIINRVVKPNNKPIQILSNIHLDGIANDN